jgi:adenosine kinase
VRALVCGALAYDTIMVFEGRFADHLLNDQLHRLSLSFHVPKMRREFGGCAGNIAYNLTQLGMEAWPMCSVGHDFGAYGAWLDRQQISRRCIRELADEFTAQGFITTDLDDNQITAFHPGAMAHTNAAAIPPDVDIGVVAPDAGPAMRLCAERFCAAQVPFVFDPGQFLHSLDGAQILAFFEQADWVTVNDYEAQMMVEQTGRSLADLSRLVQALIVTHGRNGSQIMSRDGTLVIPAARTRRVVDPTGCGDAFRAGLVFGLARRLAWGITGRIASVLGAAAVEHHGTQNHRCDPATLKARYAESFDTPLTL